MMTSESKRKTKIPTPHFTQSGLTERHEKCNWTKSTEIVATTVTIYVSNVRFFYKSDVYEYLDIPITRDV